MNSIVGVDTSSALFIGYPPAPGPGVPTWVTSIDEFTAAFGDDPGACLAVSVRLFFANGGTRACIVAAGSGTDTVTLEGLLAGLAIALELPDAPVILAPDAVRLPADADNPEQSAAFTGFAAALLSQCEAVGRFGILDVWGGDRLVEGADASVLAAVLGRFRTMVQPNTWGAAYLPWLRVDDQSVPPSGAMAGVYAATDTNQGVWNAPAGGPLAGADLAYILTDAQQASFDETTRATLCGLRRFPGESAPRVWGARTLDGNNPDYRYIQVRRTIVYIEQSIRNALDPFVFAANDANTWTTVISMISNFLTGIWSQGGLTGAKPSEAFTVQCGLGSTMTADDILQGYMIVQVTLQMIRPAEFIELTFKQRMQNG